MESTEICHGKDPEMTKRNWKKFSVSGGREVMRLER